MKEAESDDGSLFREEVDPNKEPESEGLEHMQQEEVDQLHYEFDLQGQQQFDARELSRQEEEQAEEAAQVPQFQSQPGQNPGSSQTSGQGQPSQEAPTQNLPAPSYQVSSTAHPLSVMWSTEGNIALLLHLILLLTLSRKLFYGATHPNTPTDGRYSLPNTTYRTRE